MNTNILDWPVIAPLILLLKSQKFMLAAITLLVDWAISQAPILAPVRGELIVVASVIGSMLIAGRFYEDLSRGKPGNLKPLIGPLVRLLKSRKVMIGLITLGVDILIGYFPSMEAVRAELMTILTLLGTVLIAAIAYEDGLTTPEDAPARPQPSLKQRFDTIADAPLVYPGPKG